MNYRRRANIILGAVFGLFLLMAGLKHFYANLTVIRLFYLVTEAALVGGIADWFAITAIFRRPLGFPYHTELIPKNRPKLTEALAQTVEKELLSLDLIQARIDRFQLPVLEWIDGHKEWLAAQAGRYAEDFLRSLEPRTAAARLVSTFNHELGALQLSQRLRGLVAGALESGDADKWLNLALDKALEAAKGPKLRERIYGLIKEQERKQVQGSFLKSLMADLLEATGSLNLDDAAEALHLELIARLEELKHLNHPLRGGIKEMLLQAVEELQGKSGEWLEELNRGLLRGMPLEGALSALITLVREALLAPSAGGPERTRVSRWAAVQVKVYWSRLKGDPGLQDYLNSYFRESAGRIARSEHHLIGAMVKDTLNSFSAKDLNEFVEAKAGNDLQWIRINGSILGGVIGAMMFVFINYFYEPVVTPVILSWFR